MFFLWTSTFLTENLRTTWSDSVQIHFFSNLEIENFLDEEECGLLIDIGKSKHLKPTTQHLTPMELKNPDQTFKEWDYNQDGFITPDEVENKG